ncbi:MAG: DUF4276 family protein [Cyanobacteria bacterium]|jgi:hypothetical protein|nr:DUF4276 family protein [Cyanobacteria bacterium GSL.Bin1]
MSYQYDLILLVEEPSMKKLIDVLLPRILSPEIAFLCIPHEGKQDLEKSIPRKLKAFDNKTKFIIIRDQDSGDCLQVKEKLLNLCKQAGRTDTIIRIVCHELESWFLGDLTAVETAMDLKKNTLSKLQSKQKYKDPDRLNSAKEELKKIVPSYQPNSKAGFIGQTLDLSNNQSHSFNVFIETIKNLDRDNTKFT